MTSTLLARRVAPGTVNSPIEIHHTLGEHDLIPAYQFHDSEFAPLDLSPVGVSPRIVKIVGQQIAPVESPVYSEDAYIVDAAAGIVAPTPAPSPVIDSPTLYARELYAAGVHRIQYRLGQEGGPYLWSEPITLIIHNHGPNPISALGGTL